MLIAMYISLDKKNEEKSWLWINRKSRILNRLLNISMNLYLYLYKTFKHTVIF